MNPVIRSIALRIQSSFNGYPASARKHDLHFSRPGLYPIFIIGAPRTGSTLLYQLMAKHMEVSFISNAMALLPRHMLLIARYTRRWMHNISDIKEADAGYVPGLFRPNEGGAIMRKWFEESTSEERTLVRNTLILLSKAWDAPFINKNSLNSLRLADICTIFPEARFVHVTRDPLFTAQSILLTRRSKLGDERAWLGPKPRGHQDISNSGPLYQVLWQVKRIDETISEFFDRFSPAHLVVTYEAVCQDPEEELKLIADHFGLACKSGLDTVPLSIRERVRLSRSEWNQLLEYKSTLY